MNNASSEMQPIWITPQFLSQLNRMFNHIQKTQFPGWFVGTCTNTTCSMTANLLLLIHSVGGRMIQGELGLSGDLVGGGPFHGSFDGENLIFTTCIATAQIVIEWHGRALASKIEGTYAAISEHPQFVLDGSAEQQGIWSCSFVRSPGFADPQKSEFVYIFNEGLMEGPISRKEFLAHAASDRWPVKAVVGLEDCTVWATVHEFLREKTAGEN